MRVAVIGGTGGVGRWLMAIARENGDHVKTLVRDRSKLPGDLGVVGVVEGDVRDIEAVKTVIGGTDVVFSALGGDGLGPTDVRAAGMRNIVATMRDNGITRLLAVSTAGVEPDPNVPFLARSLLLPYVFKNAVADCRAMEAEIVAAPGLVWTIVRPARLTDGPRTGLYRVNERLMPENGREISRADVADFMVRVVVDERTLRKIAAITY